MRPFRPSVFNVLPQKVLDAFRLLRHIHEGWKRCLAKKKKRCCFRCFKFDSDQSVNLKALFTNILKTLYLMPVNFILN
jgi:hypothetical protein